MARFQVYCLALVLAALTVVDAMPADAEKVIDDVWSTVVDHGCRTAIDGCNLVKDDAQRQQCMDALPNKCLESNAAASSVINGPAALLLFSVVAALQRYVLGSA